MKLKGENGMLRNHSTRREFIRNTAAAGTAGVAAGLWAQTSACAHHASTKWDKEADVVVIGAGATGLPASIKAAETGASVIVVEANYDIGGHAIVSGGNVPLGGGTSAQKKAGIEDSPDLVFSDNTAWSIRATG
jgi:hypothetical protein